MKKLLLSISLVLVAVLAFSNLALGGTARFWTVNLSDPADIQNSHTFNLDYIVSSTLADTFTVDLFQNASKIQTQNLPAPNSGRFTVTVPSDGTYNYYIDVTNNTAGDTPKVSGTVSTKVTTVTSDSVVYYGKTVNGNQVTVKFMVPAGSSITTVNIYSSTSNEFGLTSETLVASVPATPGVEQSITFTSTSGTTPVVAIVGVDATGSQSAPTGDSSATVNGSTTSTTQESESDRSRAALIAAAAVAAAAITDTSSSTDDQALTEVASAADEGLNDWQNALIVIALIILVGVAGWYIYNRYIVNIEDKKQ